MMEGLRVNCSATTRRFVAVLGVPLVLMFHTGPAFSEEFPLTRNVPIPDFQNHTQDGRQYDFNAPPEGMFRSIVLSESFDEELGFQRTHEIVPVKPTEQFQSSSGPVYIVFKLHQHYQSFLLFGLCYPEDVADLDNAVVVSQDSMYVALEDDTGYLKLPAPHDGWKPGRYKILIHAGEQVNDMSFMGTMRFTMAGTQSSAASTMIPQP
jgi:hypothetical protein